MPNSNQSTEVEDYTTSPSYQLIHQQLNLNRTNTTTNNNNNNTTQLPSLINPTNTNPSPNDTPNPHKLLNSSRQLLFNDTLTNLRVSANEHIANTSWIFTNENIFVSTSLGVSNSHHHGSNAIGKSGGKDTNNLGSATSGIIGNQIGLVQPTRESLNNIIQLSNSNYEEYITSNTTNTLNFTPEAVVATAGGGNNTSNNNLGQEGTA